MKILTYQFGEVEFEESSILKFSSGLCGFESLKQFLLVRTDDGLFHWLNSIEQPDIVFPLITIDVLDESFPKDNSYEAFGVVTFDPDPLKVTVNMKAPIYISQESKTGYQKIFDDDRYAINYNLFVE